MERELDRLNPKEDKFDDDLSISQEEIEEEEIPHDE